MKRILSLLAYVAAALVVAFVIAQRHPETLAIGKNAPLNERVSLLNGANNSLKRYGKKPLLVNFFATWCPACMQDLPSLSRLAKEYRGRVNFLGIAVASEKEKVLQLKTRFLLDYDVGTMSEEAIDLWQARALPTTYLVDTTGKIIFARSGVGSEDELRKALNAEIVK